MGFLLNSWKGYQSASINLSGERKFHQVFENVFHPLPQVINDLSLNSMFCAEVRGLCQIREIEENSG